MSGFIPFTTGELTLNRAPFTAALPDSCVIQRWMRTADAAGGYTEAWVPDSVAVACRVAPSGQRGMESTDADQVVSVETYTATLEQGTTLAAVDRIRWVTADRLLRVVGPGGRSLEHSRRVLCVEVNEEPGT